jgi:nicotianamine synthase
MNNSGTSPTSSVSPGHSRSDDTVSPPPVGGGARHHRRLLTTRSHGDSDGEQPRDTATVAAVEVRRLYEALAGQPSLTPGPAVDPLFGRLVHLVVALGASDADAVLADPGVQALRPQLLRLCAAGETALERAWATRIVASADPGRELARFPYLDNYRLLCDLEWSAVLGAGGPRPRRIAFVGGGPLPLSAMLLARDRRVAVDSFDRDHESVAQAHDLVAAVGLSGVRVAHGDTARCPDLRAYDQGVLAALVGATPSAKRAAIHEVHARMRPGALLAVRSANAARALLYPVLDLDDLDELELLSIVHPLNQVINSVVVARKRVNRAGRVPGDPRDDPRPNSTSRWAPSPAPNDEVPPWPAS